MEHETILFDDTPLVWNPSVTSTPLRRSAISLKESPKQQGTGKLLRYVGCKKNWSQVAKKLARNGVTITYKITLRQDFPNHSTPKKRNNSTPSARYDPFLASPISSLKKSFEIPMVKNISGQIKRRMKPKILFSVSQKTNINCNFCNKPFKSQDSLKKHHKEHGITYFKYPYPWAIESYTTLGEFIYDKGYVVIDLT